MEGDSAAAAALGAQVHAHTAAASGLVHHVLSGLVGVQDLEGRHAVPGVLLHASDGNSRGVHDLELLEAAALAVAHGAGEGALVSAVQLAALALGHSDLEIAEAAADHSDAAAGVLGGVQDVLLLVLHGGDLELSVGIAAQAQLHQPSLSGLLHEQVGVVIKDIAVHTAGNNRIH